MPVAFPPEAVIGIFGGLVGVILMIMVLARGAKRTRFGEDFVVVLKPDGMSTSYPVTPLVPPSLYTYDCASNEVCIMISRSPPIVFQDPRTKRIRRMWIAVEQSGLALTLSPEEAHTISVAAEALGNPSTGDILSLVKMAVEKKSYGTSVRLPNGFSVSFTYALYPAVVNVLSEILRSDAVALSSILATLRAAREAKTLAEALAIRRGIELKKIVQIGIVVLLASIAAAIFLGALGR